MVAVVFGLLFGSVAWAAQVGTGSWVQLAPSDLAVSGSGVSLDEFMNSLTDTNGLLRSIRVRNSGRITFDRGPRPLVNGNRIDIPFTYHEFGPHHSDGGGTLSSAPFNKCGTGEKGTQLIITSDPSKGSGDPVRVSQTIFEVCAKASGTTVRAHIIPFLIAGPNWSNRAIEVANILFADMGNDIQRQALRYASSTQSATGRPQAVAARSISRSAR